MNSIIDQEKKTRDWFKCSACRQRKKKCVPQPRDWENAREKCQHCHEHGLPCGPNYRKDEDPAVNRPVSENLVTQEGSSRPRGQPSIRPRPSTVQSPASQFSTSTSTISNIERQNSLSFSIGLAEDNTGIGALSDDGLSREALSRLSEFHALGTSLISASHTTVARHAHVPSQPYDHLSVDQQLHSLFIYIYRIGVEADNRGQCHWARWILFALLRALDKYPGLVDGRKRHVLLKIALLFQQLGHQWESEDILSKVAGMYESSEPLPRDHPCYLLAGSLPDSSKLIQSTLAKLWQSTTGGDHLDPNLTVPPLHRAVQDRNPVTIEAILSDPSEVSPLPSSATQHNLETTTMPFAPSTSSQSFPARVNTEERDFRNRTALFLAVVNGDGPCCNALISHKADVNTRDAHGHTVLEIAAKNGDLNIVRQLTEANALVNPNMGCCSSSPLQAAIESEKFSLDLVDHLLSLGAWVALLRYDNKSAIDLADERGLTNLAANMRQRIVDSQHAHPFMVGEPVFDDDIS